MDAPQKTCAGRIRPARMSDVRPIHALLASFAAKGLMLSRSISSLYDHLRDFVVYEEDGEIHGICALHICWDDLAEIRSLAVTESHQRCGIGAQLVESCLDEAESLEALRERLLSAYGDLPTDELAEVMAMGFAAAELAGRLDAKEESRGG